MKSSFSFIKDSRFPMMIASVVAGVLFVTMAVNASTTISTDIVTGGGVYASSTAAFTGLATLYGGATTTSITLLNGEVISNATDGVVQINGIASSTSVTLLNGETITNATDGTITLGATNVVLVGTASTSAIKVGDEASVSTINGLIFGTCTAASINVAATSSGMLTCSSATGVASTDRVFVQATSSLPSNFVVTAASSSAADTIQIRVLNTATSTPSYAADTGVNTFNFWAVRP